MFACAVKNGSKNQPPFSGVGAGDLQVSIRIRAVYEGGNEDRNAVAVMSVARA